MNSTMKAIVASICGAVIGYSLGTTVLSGVWRIISALLGGCAGWVLYYPIGLVKCVRSAAHSTASKMGGGFKLFLDEDWKVILRLLFRDITSVMALAQVGGTIMAYGIGLIELAPIYQGEISVRSAYLHLLVAYLMVPVLILLCSIGECLSMIRASQREKLKVTSGGNEILPLKLVLMVNPITAPFILLGFLVIRIKKFLPFVPLIATFCWLTLVKTFILAHNNVRLASFAGAAIGALVGLMAGHVVVAMIVGGLMGGFAEYIGGTFRKEYVALLEKSVYGTRPRA